MDFAIAILLGIANVVGNPFGFVVLGLVYVAVVGVVVIVVVDVVIVVVDVEVAIGIYFLNHLVNFVDNVAVDIVDDYLYYYYH